MVLVVDISQSGSYEGPYPPLDQFYIINFSCLTLVFRCNRNRTAAERRQRKQWQDYNICCVRSSRLPAFIQCCTTAVFSKKVTNLFYKKWQLMNHHLYIWLADGNFQKIESCPLIILVQMHTACSCKPFQLEITFASIECGLLIFPATDLSTSTVSLWRG